MLIRLVGPVEVELDGDVHRFNAPKVACVLATLADRPGEPVDLATLLARVWDDNPPDSAISVLYSYVARLRAMFRGTDAIRLGRAGKQGYVLETAPGNIDIHAIRDLIRSATKRAHDGDLHKALPLLRNADELARGEALIGVGGTWAARFREQFRTERLHVLAARYDVELRLGHHHAVVDDLSEIVAREPLDEPLAEQFMLALYRCGRAAAALHHYQAIRVGLRDRLGADPSPRLRALHRRILNHDPALTIRSAVTTTGKPATNNRSTPAQLPAAPTEFIGRKTELATIMARRAERPVVVIDGMAGSGKTALALHAAHLLAPEYPDGQLFIDLCGYTDGVAPLTADDALAQLLSFLDVTVPEAGGARATAFHTALTGRRMLLVLDNALNADQVLPLLPGNDQCSTIVTSRRRMIDLVDARPVSLSTLRPSESAQVFLTETGRADGDGTVIDRITAACGHLPLALRIAASLLQHRTTWTFEDLLHRLTDDEAGLRTLGASPRSGVTAAFDLSYFDLSESERRLFRRLSVFPGSSFDKLNAAAVADTTPHEADAVLERLVDAHLVIPAEPRQYRLHDLLRRYAAAHVNPDEHDDAWRRLIDLHVHRARVAVDLVHPNFDARRTPDTTGTGFEDADDARRWFRDSLPAITAMVDREMARENHAAVADLCAPATVLLMHHARHDLHRSLAQKGAVAARHLGHRVRAARFENQIGMASDNLGLFDEALAHFENALSIEDDEGTFVSQVTNNVGALYHNRGQSRKAAETYRAAAAIATEHRSLSAEALALCNLGEALLRLGDYDEATAALDRSEAIVTKQDNRLELMRVQYNRGLIAIAEGDHRQAEGHFNRVVAFCREHNETVGELAGLSGLAELALAQGEHDRAADLASQLLDRAVRLQLPTMEIEALTQLGQAQAGRGEHDDAAESLRAAVTLAADVGARRLRAMAEHALGEHLARHGDRDDAIRFLTDAEEYFAQDGHPQTEPIRRLLTELAPRD